MQDSASTSANTIPVIASTSFVFSLNLGIKKTVSRFQQKKKSFKVSRFKFHAVTVSIEMRNLATLKTSGYPPKRSAT